MTRILTKKVQKGKKETLNFEVSAGLKRVIGRDLITDDEVAIFELVKNSFDARAKTVQLFFDDDKIAIIDDGHGMSRDDIVEKWLLVAYSSKRAWEEGREESASYRDKIGSKRHYAGSKGIGRFSSDRLGSKLRLQSRPKGRAKTVHIVDIDWDRFEKDERRKFVQVQVDYSEAQAFDLPKDVKSPGVGTALEVGGLRAGWSRDKLLKLKASLAKLINPFGVDIDEFSLEIVAPEEVLGDLVVFADFNALSEEEKEEYGFPAYNIVNGPVENFIFDTLKEKTTFIDVHLTEDDNFIETVLIDRGEEVYQIQEPNTYEHLVGSEFSCNLFYLNNSAKNTFTRRMGVRSVRFGSVFLFRNGIRVYPFGEQDDDTLAIDRRKQQGVRRYLGTRDVIGRISVSGDEEHFKEATSRDAGLVRTPSYDQLVECFWEKCLKRLEKYVVGVSWPDKGEANATDLSRLLNDRGRSRVVEVVAQLARAKNIKLVRYSPKLVQILDEKADQFEGSLRSLRTVAGKTGDSTLLDRIAKAEKRFQELRKAEEEAHRKAEEERTARERAEKRAEAAERTAASAEAKYEEMRERNLFLASVASLDYETVVNLHHQITLYASEAGALAANKIKEYKGMDKVDAEDVISALEQTVFLNQKILAVARFATKANFKLDSGEIEEDVSLFLEQYINEIGQEYLANRIQIVVNNQATSFIRRFKPIEFSILVDNLVSNARKAKASKITFELQQSKKDQLLLRVQDNGRGLHSSIEDPEEIFEKGFSKARGSGLGLYHVRQVLSGMGGSISLDPDCEKGTCFLVRFVK